MIIKLDDEEIFSLTDEQVKVLEYAIPSETFLDEIKRRLKWVILQKYEQCLQRIKNEWTDNKNGHPSKLEKNRVEFIPTNPESLAALVFEQPNYKDKSMRLAEEKLEVEARLSREAVPAFVEN